MKQVLVGIFCIISSVSLFSSSSIEYSLERGGYCIIPVTKEAQKKGFPKVIPYSEIYRWGVSNSIYIQKDKSPHIDNYAAFLSESSLKLNFKGMKPFNTYNLIIDFVTFRGKPRNINSRLKIYADNQLLDELRFGELDPTKLYLVELPRNISYDGKVTLEFVEFSKNPGFWGFWDLVISSTDVKIDSKQSKSTKILDFQKIILDYKQRFKKESDKSKETKDTFIIHEPSEPVMK